MRVAVTKFCGVSWRRERSIVGVGVEGVTGTETGTVSTIEVKRVVVVVIVVVIKMWMMIVMVVVGVVRRVEESGKRIGMEREGIEEKREKIRTDTGITRTTRRISVREETGRRSGSEERDEIGIARRKRKNVRGRIDTGTTTRGR